jgi:hypothetical protein
MFPMLIADFSDALIGENHAEFIELPFSHSNGIAA